MGIHVDLNRKTTTEQGGNRCVHAKFFYSFSWMFHEITEKPRNNLAQHAELINFSEKLDYRSATKYISGP